LKGKIVYNVIEHKSITTGQLNYVKFIEKLWMRYY